MKKLIAIFLVLAMVFSLAACGGGEDKGADKETEGKKAAPGVGVYEGYAVEMFDELSPIGEVYSGKNSLELKSGEKCIFILDGDAIDCTWELSGENLTINIEGEECKGTLKDGVVTLDFMGLMDIIFVKEGAKAPALSNPSDGDDEDNDPTEPESKPEPEKENPVGYFTGYSMTAEGETFDRATLESLGLADLMYLVLEEDGTGRISFGDGEVQITWDDTDIYTEAVAVPYVLEGDLVTVDVEGIVFVFQRSDEEPPAPVVPGAFPETFAQEVGGDWHGWVVALDGTGDMAEYTGMEFEMVGRFIFNEDGTCVPYLASAISDQSYNFQDISGTYNEYGDLMLLQGSFFQAEITEESNFFVLDGVMYMDLYVDDGEGNTMNFYVGLRRLHEEWDLENDYPAPPEGFTEYYKDKSFMDIAASYGVDTSLIPQAPIGGVDTPSGGGAPTEDPGFSGPTAEYDYGGKGQIFFDYPADSFTFERKFGVDSLKASDGSIKISFAADWGMDDYQLRMEGFDKYVAESNGVLEEGLAYGGYEATRVTWEDVFGDITMETYILFGEGAGMYVGVDVIVYASSQDVIDANMDTIEAILHSVRLK